MDSNNLWPLWIAFANLYIIAVVSENIRGNDAAEGVRVSAESEWMQFCVAVIHARHVH